MSIAPIVRSVETKAAPERAFTLFTSRIQEWWARGTIGAKPPVAIIMEPHPGGRWFERDADGAETQWGEVLEWDPPRRLLAAWRINSQWRFDPELTTEVEVSFQPLSDGGTRVTLEHRRLEALGQGAETTRGSLDSGWPTQLAAFAAFADRAQ